MEVKLASGLLDTDSVAKDLIQALTDAADNLGVTNGIVYYDFPLFRDADQHVYRPTLLFASKSHGIFALQVSKVDNRLFKADRLIVEDSGLTQLYSIIYSKLIKASILRKTRNTLLFEILTAIYVPAEIDLKEMPATENKVIRSVPSLLEELADCKLEEDLTEEQWLELKSNIEGAKSLVKPKQRNVRYDDKTSKAALLAKLENEIANFDREQWTAAVSIVSGPQRIRGLAGSGKTVVLAMKVAHLHLADPDVDILVTFWTKSLYEFLKKLITRFYRHFADEDPNWSKIHILHGWGGRTLAGVYFNTCVENGLEPVTFQEASKHARPFEFACDQVLYHFESITARYDYVFIDEAQDFPPSFFRLCYLLTRGDERDRNIIWAYDELQTILDVHTRSPTELFGVDGEGQPYVDLNRADDNLPLFSGRHDIVLHKCYRNPREILLCAHALGFGIYAGEMVQMLENRKHWEDVGYKVEQGNWNPGEQTRLLRPIENSPLSISQSEPKEEIVKTYVARDLDEEIDYVVAQVLSLRNQGLRADDIVIICLDDVHARHYFREIANKLLAHNLMTNDRLTNRDSTTFTIEDAVTLTTVYQAKGNEASAAFVIGIDSIFNERRTLRARNKLFTAFTRAKAWLRVTGVGDKAAYFLKEVNIALSHSPYLDFVYPDTAQLIMLQRDHTDKADRLRTIEEGFKRQVAKLLGRDDFEEYVKKNFRK